MAGTPRPLADIADAFEEDPASVKGSSDHIRNDIALCQFHHWAFDSGWLSFTDDHEIIVSQTIDKNGYHEVNRLTGQSLRLPENEDMHPRPVFLRAHRQLYGF